MHYLFIQKTHLQIFESLGIMQNIIKHFAIDLLELVHKIPIQDFDFQVQISFT